ncbi:MAG: polysaccharide deacetylase family protein [Kiritimatiellae bacterium]|nr:polysaccharide deacetylase family protein [Kiritimatiellia bacterium]
MKAKTSRFPVGKAIVAAAALAACGWVGAVLPHGTDARAAAEDAAGKGFALRTNMVLNRSFFLSWDEVPEENFGRYEVYAGPAPGPLPEAPVAVYGETDHCYHSLRGLEPETEYAARVRLVHADGTPPEWSETVRATTLRDGFPEGTPPSKIVIPTFMYHHVRPLATFPPGVDLGGWYSTESFERDLAWMKAHNIHGVTSADILDGRLPENPVFLTFDDGYTDFLDYAVPLLAKYGFPAANAVVTQLPAGQSRWAVPEWPLDTLMTWPQIRKCLQQGMEIGGHTQTHVNLAQHPENIGQIQGSFDDLVSALGETPLYFCYPWGMDGHDLLWAKNAVRAAGYRLATRTWPPRRAQLASDTMFLPRQFAVEGDSLEDFIRKAGFRVEEPEPAEEQPAPDAPPAAPEGTQAGEEAGKGKEAA